MSSPDDANLFRLVYRSRAAFDASDAAEAQRIVGAIVDGARRRNAEVGVTGALMYLSPFFLQALEGSGPAVEAVFDRICCDMTHAELEIVEGGPVLERAFGNAPMRYFAPDEPFATAALIEDGDDLADVAAVSLRLFAEHCHVSRRGETTDARSARWVVQT